MHVRRLHCRYIHRVGRAAAVLAVSLCCMTACSDPDAGEPSLLGDRVVAIEPAEPDLADPVSAAQAYTEWISYAYAVLDSDVATHAFSATEEVRVNSYLVRNIQEQGRGVHQLLLESDYRIESQSDATATVAGFERWEYRYFDARTRRYEGPAYEASYDITYTVIIEEPKGWVVDGVETTPHAEVE